MNNNSATLLGYYGGDERVCLSAWQSTNIDAANMPEEIKDRIHQLFEDTVVNKKKSPKELLYMLADFRHETPFEKAIVDFQLTGDVASHIHCLKHRISSINSESARYKELDDKWYLPSDWIGIHFNNDSRNRSWIDILDAHTSRSHELYHAAIADLEKTLGRKRAKESARYFLPYNKQMDFDMCFNFRSFQHFLGLRNSEHAQKEIREIAQSMVKQVAEIPGNPFRYCLEAFNLTPRT